MSTPVYKHKVKDAVTINELYQRYQDGGEYGWYALVTSTGTVAWYNHETEIWENTGLTLDQITITTPAPEETIPEEYTVPTAQNVYVSDLARIPVLRYPKDPANTLNELINRYPDGGEHGWYAFIFTAKTFAWWNDTGNIPYWELISGSGGNADGGTLTTEEQINAAIQPALYGVELTEVHSVLGITNFSLIVCKAGTSEKISQLAWAIIDGKINIWSREYITDTWGEWKTVQTYSTNYGDIVPPINPKMYDLWTSPETLIQYQWLGAWVAFVPVTEITGIIDASVDDGIIIDCRINDGIIIDCRT